MEGGKGHSDELLRGRSVEALSSIDRNLATHLVLGVLRWQLHLDKQIQGLLKRPGARLEPEARIALRLGAFQLQFLDRVPAHAAIDDSVELVKQSGHRFASGMVNAVLRSAARGKLANEISDDRKAVEAHPAWMVERWTSFYGLSAAQAICRHGQVQPPLVARIADREAADELTRGGIRLEQGALLADARAVIAGDLTATAGLREGRVRIQDEGSQLIAELAAGAGEDFPKTVKTILDSCAAPGGKTLILAERNPTAHIFAYESNPRRFAELRTRLAAYADRVDCRLTDATGLEEGSGFDLALVDAPCSGTGTLGRNPEIRHRLRIEDFARHAERQRELLHAAIRSLRPGGRVVYSTCSLEPEENEDVVTTVLAENRNARQLSIAPHIERLLKDETLTRTGAELLATCQRPNGNLLLLPGAVPTDGFFVSLIERTN